MEIIDNYQIGPLWKIGELFTAITTELLFPFLYILSIFSSTSFFLSVRRK